MQTSQDISYLINLNSETNNSPSVNETSECHNNKYIITPVETVEIDGSILEGGGQILRISSTLSILFNKSTRISNIRGNRCNPGLQRQHLAAITALCSMTDSKLEGAKLNSKEILITPGQIKSIPESIKCDCNGAGSIGLLIQQVLTCLIYSGNKINLELVGGTIVSHAPPTFYIDDVLKLILQKIGLQFSLNTTRHGLFPTGGGVVNFECHPIKRMLPLNLTTRGDIKKIFFRVASTDNFNNISYETFAKDLFKQIKKITHSYFKSQKNEDLSDFELEDYIQVEKEAIKLHKFKNTFTLFSQAIIYFENSIVTVEHLYSEKKDNDLNNFIEKFTEKYESLLFNANVCMDEFTVDHLIIFLALADGRSVINIGEVSKHTLTAFEVIRQFIPNFKYTVENKGDYNTLEIIGIGWENQNII